MIEPSKVDTERDYEGVRLRLFHVEKLFDEFSYSIPLFLDQRVTAIVAPNGAGKTLCLRLISALFQEKWSAFSNNKFAYITYTFTDGTEVRVDQSDLVPDKNAKGKQRPSVKLTISRFTIQDEWTVKAVDARRIPSSFDRYLPFLTRRGPDTWSHDFTGETYSPQEVLEQFGDQLPEAYRDQWYGEMPERLKNLVRAVDCHLIET